MRVGEMEWEVWNRVKGTTAQPGEVGPGKGVPGGVRDRCNGIACYGNAMKPTETVSGG